MPGTVSRASPISRRDSKKSSSQNENSWSRFERMRFSENLWSFHPLAGSNCRATPFRWCSLASDDGREILGIDCGRRGPVSLERILRKRPMATQSTQLAV